jgi:hypothetical protein
MKKAVIQEKFGGDGIMSAIDSLDIKSRRIPKGDRVVVIMNGIFCPTKVVKNGAGAIAIYCLPRSATERPVFWLA